MIQSKNKSKGEFEHDSEIRKKRNQHNDVARGTRRNSIHGGMNMEHLEVTDFIRSHFDGAGRILSHADLYDATDIDYESANVTTDDILRLVEEIYGKNLIEHAIEVIESIDA